MHKIISIGAHDSNTKYHLAHSRMVQTTQTICWDGARAAGPLSHNPGMVAGWWKLIIFNIESIFMHKIISIGAHDSKTKYRVARSRMI